MNKDASDPQGVVAREGGPGRERGSEHQSLHLLRACGNPVKFLLNIKRFS